MMGLRSEGLDPGKMLRHLMVRTGLLREHPADGKIEFVHRTFRDYLVATDMLKAGESGMVVENAHKDSWYEVCRLPNLRRLTVYGPPPAADLTRLRRLIGTLELLELHGVPGSDVAATRSALGAWPAGVVTIHPR